MEHSSREQRQHEAIIMAVKDYALGIVDRPRDQRAAQNGAARMSSNDKKYGLAQSDPLDPNATLHPDCHLVMDRVSPLVGKGGTLLVAEAEFAGYAAVSRPDIKVIACEPDPEKFEALQKQINKNRLTNITLLNQSPIDVMDQMASQKVKVDAVTSFYGLHLQTDIEIRQYLKAMDKLADRGASVVIHDLSRPHNKETSIAMSGAFPSPKAPASFAEGYKNGLESALTPNEAKKVFEGSLGKGNWDHENGGPSFVFTSTLKGANAPKGRVPEPNIPPAIAEYDKVYNDFKHAYAGAMPLGIANELLKAQHQQVSGTYEAGVASAKWVGDAASSIGGEIASLRQWAGQALTGLFDSNSKTTSAEKVAPARQKEQTIAAKDSVLSPDSFNR